MKPAIYLAKMLSLVLLLAACSKKNDSTPEPPPPPPATQNDIAALNTKVQTFMTTYNVPGASLAVSKNGKLVYIKGFGNADNTTSEKVTPAHRFRLASVSKTFTGIAIMKLVQAGSVTLDQKVFGTGAILGTQYGTLAYSTNVKNITVKQLLQHTAGGWGFQQWVAILLIRTRRMAMRSSLGWVLDNKPVNNTPGTKYDYSNMGYFILGRIIEKISGKSYINFIKEDIMGAVGGTKTDAAGKTLADIKTDEVKYYGQGADATYVYNMAITRRDADGGLITTATELLKLINAVMVLLPGPIS
ncbi:MAG: serine hydrolase domain-containing protein [Bacteroidota bacterium]